MKAFAKARLCGVMAAAAICTVVAIGSAKADDPYAAEIKALRETLAKYKDVYVAVRDGYFSTVGCVHYNGDKIAGHMEYPKGAMGIHFVNSALVGPVPDPMRPSILVYEPKDGALQLVAAEWIVPAKATKTHPELFGQRFQGPMEGHEPLIVQSFVHYDLHAWLFKDNPLGLFAPTNPDVKCDGYNYSLLEEPTRIVPQQ